MTTRGQQLFRIWASSVRPAAQAPGVVLAGAVFTPAVVTVFLPDPGRNALMEWLGTMAPLRPVALGGGVVLVVDLLLLLASCRRFRCEQIVFCR